MALDNDAFKSGLKSFYGPAALERKAEAMKALPFLSTLTPEALPYTDEELIAKGGMKSITKAYDQATGRNIALARLHADSSEELYEPFLREARLTALLDHPNIITIHTIGLDEESIPYFTMELKTGDDLTTLIESQHNDEPAAISREKRNQLLNIFVKICDAISYAHSHGILHLDLKPANIQVGVHGEVIICDWGLGKVIDQEEFFEHNFSTICVDKDLLNDMTLSGNIKGTPGFMAPEQAESKGIKTIQTDIYALGAILYSMLTNNKTIAGDTETILEKTVAGEVISPDIRYPEKGIPYSLNAIIMKALALNPAERYSSVDLLIKDVQNFLNGYATAAENAGLLKEIKFLYIRKKALCNTLLVSMTLLISATIYYIQQLDQSRITAEQALLNAEEERQKSELLYEEARQNLERYKQEKKKTNNMGLILSEEFTRDSARLRNRLFFKNPKGKMRLALERLKLAIKLDPSNKKPINLVGKLLFIKQDFGEALSYFKKFHYDEELFKLTKEMVQKTHNGEKQLTVIELASLIRTLATHTPRTGPVYERLIAYDHLTRKNDKDYHLVVESLLDNVNKLNDSSDFSFKYNVHSQLLTIRGKDIHSLAGYTYAESTKCLLRFIPVKRLDLRKTNIGNLHQLNGLQSLVRLDIRNTPIINLNPLKKLPNLQTLVISKGQFSNEKLKQLHPKIKVIVKSQDIRQ